MTTLEEVEGELPNGLHDACLRSMCVDYGNAELILVLDVDVSTTESGSPEYSLLELKVMGLLFAAVDAPTSLLLSRGKGVWIGAGPGQPGTAAEIEVPELPTDCFLHWLFVHELNAFIRIAGREASYRWLT